MHSTGWQRKHRQTTSWQLTVCANVAGRPLTLDQGVISQGRGSLTGVGVPGGMCRARLPPARHDRGWLVRRRVGSDATPALPDSPQLRPLALGETRVRGVDTGVDGCDRAARRLQVSRGQQYRLAQAALSRCPAVRLLGLVGSEPVHELVEAGQMLTRDHEEHVVDLASTVKVFFLGPCHSGASSYDGKTVRAL